MKLASSLFALMAAGVLIAPQVAQAEANSPTGRATTVDELVVTAGKREQSLQDVPVSVAVVTGDTIKDLALTNLDQLSRYVPGLIIQEGGEQTGISIRGFGAGLNFGIDQSVGLFVDEIYAGRERQFRGTFLDVQRVEVLKGPQGTLFGKNTIAGAVTITSGTPTWDPSLSTSVEYGPDTGRRAVEVVANGPITSTLAGRLAVRLAKETGYMYNTLTREKEERTEDKIVRGTLLWKPTDQLTARGKVEWSEFDRVGRNFNISEISGFAVGRPLITNPVTLQPRTTPVDVGAAARLSTYQFYDPAFSFGLQPVTSKQRESAHVISKNAALDISYDLGSVVFRSITGVNSYKSNDQRDVDWSPTPFLFEPITQKFTQWSQEFRVVSDVGEHFDYIAGLYWFRTDFFVDRRTDVDINLFINPAANSNLFKWANLRFLNQTAETYSAYAQGTWHITPDLHLTGGLRWMTETKNATDKFDRAAFGSTRFLDPNNPADAALIAVGQQFAPGIAAQAHFSKGKLTEKNVTPEVKLSWDINDDIMLYASGTRGYKGGGFNSNSITPNRNDQTFRPETATAFELGGKTRLLDRRMNVNFAFFRQDFKDLQLSIWQGNGFFLTNAGAARSQGFEADFNWVASDRLRLNGAVTLIDATYTKSVDVACNIGQLNFGQGGGCHLNAQNAPVQDFKGRHFAPKYSATLGGAYTHPLGDDLELTLRADAQFRAKGEFALDPTIVQPAYQSLDLGATLRPLKAGQQWTLGVVVQNVFDSQRFFFEFEAPAQTGTRIGYPAPGRTAVFRATYDF